MGNLRIIGQFWKTTNICLTELYLGHKKQDQTTREIAKKPTNLIQL